MTRRLSEQEAEWALTPDARELDDPSPCPCGKAVVRVESNRVDGMHPHTRIVYHHADRTRCEFQRRFRATSGSAVERPSKYLSRKRKPGQNETGDK